MRAVRRLAPASQSAGRSTLNASVCLLDLLPGPGAGVGRAPPTDRLAWDDADVAAEVRGRVHAGAAPAPTLVADRMLFAEALQAAGVGIDYVVDIETADEEILRRMSGRRVHPASGRTYHVEFNPPKVAGIDDVTGEPLVQRPDDLEETVRKRIDTYHVQTKPLVDYYRSRSGPNAARYVKINGVGAVEAIRDGIFAAID